MAKQFKQLEERILGQERKLVERHLGDDEFSRYELDLLRHYEKRRSKVYEKLKRVLEREYGVAK